MPKLSSSGQEMQLEYLTAAGAAQASLLRELCALQGPFEGLIIGRFETTTSTVVEDSHDAFEMQHLTGHLTRFHCSHGLGSFYDAAGQILGRELNEVKLEENECILGWFVHQTGPKRELSARERTVTAGLAAFVPPGMPVLFGIITLSFDHSGATIGFNQQILEQIAGTLLLRPVELRIDNLTGSGKQRQYPRLPAVFSLAPVPMYADSSRDELVHTALNIQPRGIEKVFERLISEMEQMSQAILDSELKTLKSETMQMI